MANDPREILFVVYEGIQALDLVGPVDVFDVAGRVLTGSVGSNTAYTLTVAGPTRDPVRAWSGLRIHVDVALAEVRRPIDTLVVVGGPGTRAIARDVVFVGELRRVAGAARRVTSVCSGALVLAAAGLLTGRRATTHWASCAELAERYPDVAVQPDAIYVRDGNLATSAGVTAGMDLALALVEDDLGQTVTLDTARWLVLFVRRPGGQSQFSAQLRSQWASPGPIRALQTWILEHVSEPLTVEQLASRAAMSPRNFARVFRREVGVTPAVYVEQVRIEVARRLLETTGLQLPAIAEASGFGSDHTLRQAFARRVGVTPTEYRARFSPDDRRWTS